MHAHIQHTYIYIVLILKVVGSQTLKDAGKPVKVAESDVDVSIKYNLVSVSC